jgi:signal transduction histidine kinase
MVVGGASIAALATVFSLISGVGAENVLVSVLLCAALGLVGSLLSRSRADQEQTEVLLARLEDARDAQLEAATLAERARIARELHDVLAHSLSGLAIQLEAARKLVQRDGVGSELQDVVDRAAALAKGGLTDARRAVDALRGGDMASVEHLPELVSHYRDDLGLPVCLAVRGDPRPLTTGASLALYRAAGEALTNVVRHAPGSLASVTVTWRPGEVRLVVDNEMVDGAVPLAAPGPRWGLAGIGERVALVGGRSSAGPTATGWQVQVTVPG